MSTRSFYHQPILELEEQRSFNVFCSSLLSRAGWSHTASEKDRGKREENSLTAHGSSKHLEAESVWTTDTERQGTTTQPWVSHTYVSPEPELFRIQPTQRTGRETGFVPAPCGDVPLLASMRNKTVQ